MPLQFLEFDLSEDSADLCSWDALASPAATHTAALLAEVQTLLHQLTLQFGPAGPVDEGHAWDLDLDIRDESGQALHLQATPAPGLRITLALSLTGDADLAAWLL